MRTSAMHSHHLRFSISSSRKGISLLLAFAIFGLAVPETTKAEATKKMIALLNDVKGSVAQWLRGPKNSFYGRQIYQRGLTPTAESRDEKEARVAYLKVNPAGPVVMQSEQPMIF